VRRGLYWTAVIVAVAALFAGSLFAYVAYRDTSGPDGAVRGYFDALIRDDAAAAVAFGDVPAGPKDLLTDQVLAEQQSIAPMHDVSITGTTESGDRATVGYSYVLAFPDKAEHYDGSLRLVRHDGGWRLGTTAVATDLQMDQAVDRFNFAGTTVPNGRVLIFPGALPVQFDTPYLRLDPATRSVQFGDGRRTDVRIEPTAAGNRLLTRHLRSELRVCMAAARPSASCPVPSPRMIPGSMHGRVTGVHCTYRVTSEAAGTVSISGNAFFVGRYRTLSYDNVPQLHTGRLALPVNAQAYPVAPLSVSFTAPR
jgi:hypothetical protein